MTKLKTIVLATDLSDRGNEAIRQAHSWAVAAGARLVACVVLPESPIRPVFPHAGLQASRNAELAGLGVADALRERCAAVTGRAEDQLEICVERGRPYLEILRAAEREHADLIVIGAQGEGGLRRFLLGSTAEKVVRHAKCSVLVARPSADTNRVLVATDLSDPSMPALRAGADVARAKNGELLALHCFDAEVVLPVPSASFTLAVPAVDERRRMRAAAGAALGRALETYAVDAKPLVEEGRAAKMIVDVAERLSAEIVVVGTAGRSGLAELAFGSVAKSVVRAAPCSVLVVRLRSAR